MRLSFGRGRGGRAHGPPAPRTARTRATVADSDFGHALLSEPLARSDEPTVFEPDPERTAVPRRPVPPRAPLRFAGDEPSAMETGLIEETPEAGGASEAVVFEGERVENDSSRPDALDPQASSSMQSGSAEPAANEEDA
ncbi:MAG TPA: hypothetical protein RMH99_32010 [Sandaracinaceae bacterium LLY-WYZ-13_1]|nr:hypothetical protein [Sandaracinaceae bacterium LLY-WYZ-13_1]